MSILLKQAEIKITQPDGTQSSLDVVVDETRANAVTQINTLRDQSIAAMENKKNSVLSQIPDDYTQLSESITNLSLHGIGTINSTFEQKTITGDGSENYSSSHGISGFIKIDRTITLLDDASPTYNKRICYYDEDKNLLSRAEKWNTSKSITFKKNDTYAYIKVDFATQSWSNFDAESLYGAIRVEYDSLENIRSSLIVNNNIYPIWEDGYVNASGNLYVGTDGGFVYSSTPISLKKGDKLILNGKGYSTNIAMIATYRSTLTNLSPLVVSDGNDIKDYIYIATDDIDVVLSANKNAGQTVIVISPIAEQVASNTAEIAKNTKAIYELRTSEINYMQIFHTIGIIGDSLSSGEIAYADASGEHYIDRYDFSWLSNICRTTGATPKHYSEGGMFAKKWITSTYKTNFDNDAPQNAYFIALGTNDRNQSYGLGSINDASGSNSFVGYYKQIVDMVIAKAPNACIFLVSMYSDTNDTYKNYSAMIKSIADLYTNCYYVDFIGNTEIRTTDGNTNYTNYGHFTTSGYVVVAKTIKALCNKIIADNLGRNFFKLFAVNN